LLLSKIADPRIEPARVSVTRVEMPEDLMTAKVFISVMGTEGQQRAAMAALQHMGGHIQELMMEHIQLRNTPILTFELDVKFKKTLETYAIIAKAAQELREKEAKLAEQGQAGGPAEGSAAEDEKASEESEEDADQE
jgi:ribosome-binding factor A